MLRYWKEIKNEKLNFEPLYANISDKILKHRIKSMGEWYIEYACKNKFKFYMFSFISIIAPLIVMIFNAFDGNQYNIKLVTMICSVITSFSSSYLALTRCLEKWKIYRDAIENLKSILALYWGNFSDDDLKSLSNKIEKLKKTEYAKWSNTYDFLVESGRIVQDKEIVNQEETSGDK